MYFFSRWTYAAKARLAASSPSPARRSTSRMSLSPHMPSRPLFLFRSESISSTEKPPTRARWKTTAGSTSPERVPMTSPSSGVRPMDVSTHTPPRTAEAEAPLPRCSTITFTSSTGLPSSRAVARET